VARLKEKWLAEMDEWNTRRLDDLEVVYVWADGVYVKAGLEKDKAAILVLMAGWRTGKRLCCRCNRVIANPSRAGRPCCVASRSAA
jgi:hypothetical protein